MNFVFPPKNIPQSNSFWMVIAIALVYSSEKITAATIESIAKIVKTAYQILLFFLYDSIILIF